MSIVARVGDSFQRSNAFVSLPLGSSEICGISILEFSTVLYLIVSEIRFEIDGETQRGFVGGCRDGVVSR